MDTVVSINGALFIVGSVSFYMVYENFIKTLNRKIFLHDLTMGTIFMLGIFYSIYVILTHESIISVDKVVSEPGIYIVCSMWLLIFVLGSAKCRFHYVISDLIISIYSIVLYLIFISIIMYYGDKLVGALFVSIVLVVFNKTINIYNFFNEKIKNYNSK